MHPGNLFVDDDGRLVAVDFGIMGRLGPKERRFLAEILYGFITRDYRRTAEVHFEAGYVPRAPFGRELRAGDPRHRRADPQPHRRRHLDGEAADAAVRGHRPVRHAHAAGAAAAAEDHGGGRGRGALARSQARHVDDGRAGGARMDRAPSRARPASSRTPPKAPARSAASSARCRRCSSRGPTLVEQLDAITRDGLVLAPETVAAIGAAEARRNRWTAVGAVGDRGRCWLWLVLSMVLIALIAMQS